MTQYFTSLEPWKELLAGDFERGYLTGVLLVLTIVVVMLLLRIVLGIVFRTRRARAIVVSAPDGDVQIAREAVSAAVDSMLTGFPELSLDSLKIYRRGRRRYSLLLECRFLGGGNTFPDIVARLKETIFEGMKKQFGITALDRIRIVLSSWEQPGEQDAAREKTAPAQEDAAAVSVPMSGTDVF